MTDDRAAAAPAGVVAPSTVPEAAAPAVIDRGRSAALTAIGQVFVLVGASLIGVVVAATLAPGARLDAYFTASQLTVAALYVGQALRTSVPGLATGGVVATPVLARAAAVMTVAVGGVLLVGAALGPMLVTDASGSAMRSDLFVLLPGAVCQVGAGYAAGRLAMSGEFAGAALAYALGTALNAILLGIFIGASGAGALAPAALAGWLTSAALIAVLWWRSTRRRLAQEVAAPAAAAQANPADQAPVGVLGAAGRITLSVTPVLAAQLVIVACVTAATHIRDGGSTIVSLAFLATNAIGTVAVAPIPIVLSADLGSTWDRRPDSLIPLMLSIVRLSVAVTMPLVLGLVLVGRPLANFALGGLTPGDVDDLFTVAVIVLPSLPLTAASMVGLVAAFALDRLGAVARAVLAAAIASAAAIVVVVTAGGSLVALAIVGSLAAASLGAATITAALGRDAPRAIAAVGVQAARVGGPTILVLAAALLSGTADGIVRGVAWGLVGAAVHLGWLRSRHPAELAVLLGVVRR